MIAPVRFGLVGAGAIAQSYVKVFESSNLTALTAVVDVRADAARALAEIGGGAVLADPRSLAESGICDAVVVCTPPHTHEAICIELIEHDIPVLCEKPLSLNPESVGRMIEVAVRRNVALTMASKFRYVEDVIRAKSILESGILGEIILFENAFTSRVDMAGRWNADPALSGGGVLIDNGTHSVDIARYFLGGVVEVQAVEGKRVQALAVEDTVRLFLRTESGVMGTIDLSWTLNKELSSFIDLYGSRGVVRVGWNESVYRQTGNRDWIRFGEGYDKHDAMQRMVENFCKYLLGEERLLTSLEDILSSAAVIETAYTSMRSDRWVQVPVLHPARIP